MKGTLLITDPPATSAVLSNPLVVGPGTIQFDVAGTPNRVHSIEASSNPATGWTELGTTNAPASGAFTFIDTNATTAPTRFYRVVTE
jgi:hypothetical protein